MLENRDFHGTGESPVSTGLRTKRDRAFSRFNQWVAPIAIGMENAQYLIANDGGTDCTDKLYDGLMQRSRKERRKGRRDPLTASVPVLFGSSPEEEQVARASLLDVSETGARFGLTVPVPVGGWLMFNHYQVQISGRGTVRFCRRVKSGYEIGVEFSGGTGWDAAAQRLRESLPFLKHDPASELPQQAL